MTVRGSLWYRFVRWLVRTFFFGWRTGGLKRWNSERLPLNGGIILACNHVSNLDPPAVACACPRPLTFMAKIELFKGLFGKILRSLGAFPVRRGEGDTESIRKSLDLLASGQVLLVFPEGTRGDGKRLGPFNRGVAMLAKRAGVPIVPVAIVGSHIVLPRGVKKKTRHRIDVAYGEPFTFESVATSESEKENRELFSQALRSKIEALAAERGLKFESGAELEPTESSDPAQKSHEAPTP